MPEVTYTLTHDGVPQQGYTVDINIDSNFDQTYTTDVNGQFTATALCGVSLKIKSYRVSPK